MGYRSKVIMGVKEGKVSDGFDRILKRHDFNPHKYIHYEDDYLKVIKKDGMKIYTFDYVKWYSSHDWVEEIMDSLEFNNDFNQSAWCVGIGEEGELHSEIGNYWEFIDVIRDINLKK